MFATRTWITKSSAPTVGTLLVTPAEVKAVAVVIVGTIG
jgi:hypothetical protein